MLRLERISKRYSRPGGSRVALDDVSIELDRGQIMGIFGPSGSGKTTLLRIAAGLRRADSGTVTYNGERLDQMSAAERTRFRRREIACVWAPQSWQEGLSVLDHVALPLLVDRCGHRSAERRVREALLACEAEQCVDMELHAALRWRAPACRDRSRARDRTPAAAGRRPGIEPLAVRAGGHHGVALSARAAGTGGSAHHCQRRPDPDGRGADPLPA